tara:strand:- start:36 stop:839 length:804 start_codon:yes stop_codon:yes gene_type:complete
MKDTASIETETYYISTGALTSMYTLRLQWYEYAVIEGTKVLLERDSYIRNLSTDADTATEKALAMGYTVRTPLFDLNDIKRRRSEEINRLVQEREEMDERNRVAKEERLIDSIKAGLFPFGRFGNKKFEVADRSYIMYWLMVKPEDSVSRSLVETLKAQYPEYVRILQLKANDEYFGTVKTRYKSLVGTIIADFGYVGFYGWVSIVKIILDSGELVVYQGTGNLLLPNDDSADVGDVVTFDATVKSHEVYNEEIQTRIQRLKYKEVK